MGIKLILTMITVKCYVPLRFLIAYDYLLKHVSRVKNSKWVSE